MAVSKARIRAVTKYNKSHYDQLGVRVPKEKYSAYREAAKENGLSFAEWVQTALDAAACGESFEHLRAFLNDDNRIMQ